MMDADTETSNTTKTPLAPQPFEVTVARKLEGLSYSLLDTFLRLDVDRDGFVTRSDLKTALHNVLGIDLSQDQMDAIFLRFAYFEDSISYRTVDGIRYQEFVRYMDATAKSRLSLVAPTIDGSTLLDSAGKENDASSKSKMLPIVISPQQARSKNRQELLRLLTAHSTTAGGVTQATSLFLQMDTHRSGKVLPSDFCDWVNHHHGKELLTIEMFEDLMGPENYKADGMNYKEFVAAVLALQKEEMKLGQDEETWEEEQPHVEEAAKEHYQEAVQDCVDNAKSDVEIARVIAEQIFQKRVKLVDAFHKYDLDGSGRLKAEDLCKALNEAGLHVSVERAQSLVNKFDLDGDGRLNKVEFVKLIASSNDAEEQEKVDATATTTEELRRSLVASIVGHEEKSSEQATRHEEITNRFDEDDIRLLISFREALEAEKIMTRKVFQSMDMDGDKTLSAKELKEGFEQMGVNVSQEHINHLMSRFETEGTGKMKYYQFVKLISANLDHALDA